MASSESQDGQPSADRLPAHVAIIMDGNGRWARRKMLPRTVGHQRGKKAVRRTIEAAMERGIPALTLFAFSSENWGRPVEEVDTLMRLFVTALEKELDELDRHDIRLRFIGERDRLPERAQELMAQAEARTASNERLALTVAVSYGGRWDILQAARRAAASAGTDGDLGEFAQAFESSLSTAGLPPVDLFIRTGGERRISNFLLWQIAYAELWFADTLWPDFDGECLDEALQWFSGRERRFGRV
ncbi:MAG: polyprenyl diphosphate synthase [Halothiobacillaceae bacterium]